MSTMPTFAAPRRAQRGGGDRGVVEVAGAAEAGRRRVVAGRAAERVGQPGAVGDQPGGLDGAVDGRAGRLPGARADQRHRVVGEPAGVGVDRRPPAGPGARRSSPASGTGTAPPAPGRPGRRTGPRPSGRPRCAGTRRSSASCTAQQRVVRLRRRLDEVVTVGAQRVEDRVDPVGALGALGRYADPDLVPRVVRGGSPATRRPGRRTDPWVSMSTCPAPATSASPSARCRPARPTRCSTSRASASATSRSPGRRRGPA